MVTPRVSEQPARTWRPARGPDAHLRYADERVELVSAQFSRAETRVFEAFALTALFGGAAWGPLREDTNFLGITSSS